MNKFEELYQKLNPEQKEAVDTIEGPVMVVAGPGTGKTRILTLRIANILLKTQINPANILALTFTENAAAEMRRRLAEIIGPTAYQVNIATFHGFCNELIQSYPEEFSRILNRHASSEISQIQILKNIIESLNLKILKPFGEPFFYLKEAKARIGQLKREGVSFFQLKEILKKEAASFESADDLYYQEGRYKGKMKGKYADVKKQLDKNLELVRIYEKYQSALAEAKLYDYDDMILEVVEKLKNDQDFLLKIQEKFQYILVDEHQDTNNAQNQIIEFLSNFFENPNLFVVGDERQAIFRFQGASLANFLCFKTLYPQAKLITLQKNYRSAQPILDAAQSFIQNNQQKLSLVLAGLKDGLISQRFDLEISKRSNLGNLGAQIYEFKRPETEYYFLANKIKQLISEKTAPAEIALIYRDNKDAFPIAEMLEKQNLPFRIESGANVLEDGDLNQLLVTFRFLDDFSSEEKLFNLLLANFLEIPPLDVYKLTSPGVRRKTTFLELLLNLKRLKELKIAAPEKINDLALNLLNWHKLSKNAGFAELFETVARDSGYLKYILAKKNSAAGLVKIDALFSEIKKMIINHPEFNLADFISYLDALKEHGLAVKSKDIIVEGVQAVKLMTAHGAKGREFDHVFIANVFDGHWGNRRVLQLIKLPKIADNLPLETSSGGGLAAGGGTDGTGSLGLGERGWLSATSSELDDERRLFYVAITRARKMAYVSYSLAGFNARQQFPSQFLQEIKPEFKKIADAQKYENELEKTKEILFHPRKTAGFSIFDKEYLNHLFLKRGFSATALNNFLKCPWRYFYLNLLKIPKAKTKHQMYGTAVHAALKNFFDGLKYGKQPDENFLVKNFEAALAKEPLLAGQYEEVLKKGRTALKSYFSHYHPNWSANTLNEFRISNIFLNDKIKLTGSLDKIEYLSKNEVHPSRQGRTLVGLRFDLGAGVNVVDYKTGRPRSRNELEGKTKNSAGDYKRQLVFYKLLLDEHPTLGLKMTSGEIDFIEPDAKSKFHKEKFEITQADVKELKNLILDVSDKILNLKFWDNRCDDQDCEFCKLKFLHEKF